MNPFNYNKLQGTADRLIDKYGDDAVWNYYVDVPAPLPFDPPTRTLVVTPIRAVFLRATIQYTVPGLINVGDEIALISGKLPESIVSIKGTLKRGAEQLKIEYVKPLKPGPLNMLYKVKVSQ